MLIKIIAFIGAAAYYAAFACAELKKSKLEKLFWMIGIAVSVLLVGRNWVANGYVPFVSMYQVLTFLSLTFFPIYLLIKYLMNGGWMARYFQFTAGLVLTGVAFMDATSRWAFPPSLQSIWFVPHVLMYMIGYTLTTVACLVMVVSFFKKGTVATAQEVTAEVRRSKLAKQRAEKAAQEAAETAPKSDREIMQEGCNSLARVAFPFMTAGMFFGAIWANQVWGNYWSWDLKENWALITWLIHAVYLHFYKDKKLRKFTPIFIILSFVGILMTMVFINFFESSGSMHTYS